MSNEREVLDALRVARYSHARAGVQRWSYAEHVRSGTGIVDGKRIADAIAVDLWGSREIHGHEVKVSRSDWLAELRSPEKAEAFRPYVNRWWLVVSDLKIVRDDLPEGWGLILANWTTCRVVHRAPRNEPLPMPRELLGGLLRATATTAVRLAA